MEQYGFNCVDGHSAGFKNRWVPISKTTRKTLGLALRGYRQDRNWRQIDAQVHTHVSRVTIGKIENGHYVLNRTLEKYVAAYGTSVRELLQTEPRDDLDDESYDIGRRYRLASTPVRQAVSELLKPKERK